MTVHALLAAVDPAGACLPAQAWDSLTAEERARADRFRRPADRAQFAAARWLVHAGLRECFGATGARIVTAPGTKPTLVGPGLPPGLDFNISHADGLVACAFGVGVAVGIDVERRDRVVDAPGIAAAQFAPAERDGVIDTDSFLRLWTLKEAVAKAVGLGLALKLASFVCAVDPPRLVSTAAALGAAEAWRLDLWDEATHVVALAARGAPQLPARMRRVPLSAP